MVVPENFVCEFWKMHIADDSHYSNLTSSMFGEYLPYSGSSVATHEVDMEANYETILKEYRHIFGRDPIEELWRPFREEDETLIKVNLFNLIVWEAFLLIYKLE